MKVDNAKEERKRRFKTAFDFANQPRIKLPRTWCDEQVRGAVQLMRDHRSKSTRFFAENPVMQLAALMNPSKPKAVEASREFAKLKQGETIKQAAKWYGLTEEQFVAAATDTRYIGPARALVDDALWKQVVSMRSNYDTSELEALLRLNFEHLPVGNAYSEFLVKLIKGSTSESRAYTGTLLRALRARAASHVWLLDQATFQLVRKILGHNIALRAAPRPTIVDASHLDLSITSKNHSEPQLSALKVEDSQRKQGKIEYQVRWKGFHSDGDMTWEPATALAGCSALISDFDNKKEKR